MKPFFGLDITYDKDNEKINGNEFIIREVPEERQKQYEEMLDSIFDSINATEPPNWLQLIKSISGLIGAVGIISYIRVVFDIGLAKAISNAPFVAVLTVAAIATWFTLTYMTKRRVRLVSEERDIEGQQNMIDAELAKLLAILEVPAEAQRLDLIAFSYSMLGTEIVPYAQMKRIPAFVLAEFYAYADEEGFCLAYASCVYRFEKSDLKYIETVNEHASVYGWNKDEYPSSENFRKYKLTTDAAGYARMNRYYIMHIEKDGEEYGLYFPSYELPLIERISGLSAEE
ncbi:MAG: hypothetical protein E7617_00385 [Ruminococcaceae bacterium]|nr:hypothetical protein [Oscillospiraceae bacterium]